METGYKHSFVPDFNFPKLEFARFDVHQDSANWILVEMKAGVILKNRFLYVPPANIRKLEVS